MELLFDFFLNSLSKVAECWSWLTTSLQFINLSPLDLFSIGGLTALLGIHLIRLFVGG